MFWAPVCDGKSEARDFRGTGVCEIIAHLKRLWWFPPFPPDPKLNNWPANLSASVCEINAQNSKGPRLIIFNFGSGGGEGTNVLKNIKYKWAIILQTPVPRKSRDSDLLSQRGAKKHITRGPRLVTTFYTDIPKIGFGIEDPGPSDKLTSLVLFSVPCRSPQRRPSVRQTLGTKKSLAPRTEFLGRAWSAPRGLARAPPNGHRCRRRSHEQVIVSARALENPKRFAPDACQ